MDLLNTPSPSIQSLLESDVESVESFQFLAFEELDEVEYALPTRQDSPTLAEVLLEDETEGEPTKAPMLNNIEPMCSALQVDFLQAISQQLTQAQERSAAGAATCLSVGSEGKMTVGTAHGHLLSFHDQTLRWVCDSNTDRGAVSCLCYNHDSTRLLVGYARGLICQYESTQGVVLRRVTLGGDTWGILQVTWAGMSGLALDTGGSVWLIKFSRLLGVRSAKSSCLFSGARGEVVAMAARDARILALATLSRVIIVAGGHAAGMRLPGSPDTLPSLTWSETNDRVLVCARDKTLQWLAVNVTGSDVTLRTIQRAELKTTPLWVGWLGGCITIFDADENLRLWGDDYDKPLDLSHIEPVYASAFFKGLWTDGRVSQAMCKAGVSAVGGVCLSEGALSILGRRGVVRVKPRDLLARANTFILTQRYSQAIRLLCSIQTQEAKAKASDLIFRLSETPEVLTNKRLADQVVRLCVKHNICDELWSTMWEKCWSVREFVESIGESLVRGEMSSCGPTPDCTQALIERLADTDPDLVERVIASVPFNSLDPHRASLFTRERRLWRGVGAVAAALGGSSGAIRELVRHVDLDCRSVAGVEGCRCAGGALVVAAADALAGRGVGGRPLPAHARPSARHLALQTLVDDECGEGVGSPLSVLVRHEARSAVRLLEQCARDPPFAGPLAKQNRLRVARAILPLAHQLQDAEDRTEILEFIAGQLSSGALPPDKDLVKSAQELATATSGERSDRAWLALAQRAALSDITVPPRPRVLTRIHAMRNQHQDAIDQFFNIEVPSETDIDEFFDYLHNKSQDTKRYLEPYISRLIDFRPRATAAFVEDERVESVLKSKTDENVIEFAECLLENGRLRGAAAAAHLRNLCLLRPAEAKTFILNDSGVVRPEDALKVVRETGRLEAEPACLEAVGDHSAALDSLLSLASSTTDSDTAKLYEEAFALCARVSQSVPTDVAADMWRKLLRRANYIPPGLLLEASSCLSADELIERTCASARVAVAMLECALMGRRAWGCVSRIAGREGHDALSRTMRRARRAVAVRGRCVTCERPLVTAATVETAGPVGAVRTGHCARAWHATCAGEARCGGCGTSVSSLPPLPLPPRASNCIPSPPVDLTLNLLAPPRPDLEGIA